MHDTHTSNENARIVVIPPEQRQTVYAFMEMFMWHDTSSQSSGYWHPGIRKAPTPVVSSKQQQQQQSNGTSQKQTNKFIFMEPDKSFENSETKRRLHNLLEVTNLLHTHLYRIPPHEIEPASMDLLTKFHSVDYLQRIKEQSEKHGGDAGESVPFGPGSFEIARYAVGACVACVDTIMDKSNNIKNGYALVRPPGHHAERDMGRGYCMLNNIVLTAMHLKQKYGLKRIGIFDFDVHHGNGTQQAFYEDPSVLYISIHEEDHFPKQSGFIDETGEGSGEGFNINIPLPPGSGIGAYQYAMEQCVCPALRAFEPDFILVSSGFDAAILDPLGRMQLVSSTFRYMTDKLMGIADECCDGRLCFLHEGGYSPVVVPLCGLKTIEALCGVSEDESIVFDPFDDEEVPKTTQRLKDHEKSVVDNAVALSTILSHASNLNDDTRTQSNEED